MRANTGSAAPPPGQASVPTRHHRNTSRRSGNQWLPAQKLFPKWKDGTHGTEQNLLLPSRCGDVALVLGAWPGGGATEPVLAHILTPPQHVVKFFCHLHRLSYYVVMLRYIFRILFSSLCCAVIGFVAGIFHGVIFDTFCIWACNSPYFILIFLLS